MASTTSNPPSTEYFGIFPKVKFDIDKTYNYKDVPDLTVTARFRQGSLDLVKQYQPYYIPDGERPDMTSFNNYGTVQYVWVIMYVNNIQNVYNDWPRSDKRMEERLIRKYGSIAASVALIHHYEDNRGNEIDRAQYIKDTENNRQINHFDFEIEANEAKREIILPQEAYLPTLLNDLSNIFGPTP